MNNRAVVLLVVLATGGIFLGLSRVTQSSPSTRTEPLSAEVGAHEPTVQWVSNGNQKIPVCPFCRNSVALHSTACGSCTRSFRWEATECPTCNGTGKVQCLACQGRGNLGLRKCANCRGAGEVFVVHLDDGRWQPAPESEIKEMFCFGRNPTTYINWNWPEYGRQQGRFKRKLTVTDEWHMGGPPVKRVYRCKVYACPTCRGSGSQVADCPGCHGAQTLTCGTCGGDGHIGD
jgi:hypothetical protein